MLRFNVSQRSSSSCRSHSDIMRPRRRLTKAHMTSCLTCFAVVNPQLFASVSTHSLRWRNDHCRLLLQWLHLMTEHQWSFIFLHFHSKVERPLSCVSRSAWSRVGEAATWVTVVLWAETLSFYIVATSQQLVLKSMSPDAWWDDTSWTRWAPLSSALFVVCQHQSFWDWPHQTEPLPGAAVCSDWFHNVIVLFTTNTSGFNVVDESVSLQRYRRTLLLTRWGCIHRGRHWWCNWSADRSYPQPWGRRERKDSRRQVQQKERLCF